MSKYPTVLEDLGVPPKHIAYLEGQTIQGYGLPSKVFDYLGRVNNVIIPTHLIIGSHLEATLVTMDRLNEICFL